MTPREDIGEEQAGSIRSLTHEVTPMYVVSRSLVSDRITVERTSLLSE